MEQVIRKVLAVGTDEELHGRLEPLLRRASFDVDRLADPASAMPLIEAVAFDVLVLGYPLTSPDTAELIALIRREGAPCRGAAVLILAHPSHVDEARRQVEDRQTRVMSADVDASLLQRAIAELLRVAPRVDVRLAVRLEVQLGDGPATLFTQTENLSMGGFLARNRRSQPMENRVVFELFLPGGLPSVRGNGEVVRHIVDWQGATTGVAVRFLGFSGEGKALLSYFLAARLSAAERAP